MFFHMAMKIQVSRHANLWRIIYNLETVSFAIPCKHQPPPFEPPPPSTQVDPIPNYNTLGWLRTLYEVLHEVQTIKICFFDEMVLSEMKICPKKPWKPLLWSKTFQSFGSNRLTSKLKHIELKIQFHLGDSLTYRRLEDLCHIMENSG